jgi:hypothetical protein
MNYQDFLFQYAPEAIQYMVSARSNKYFDDINICPDHVDHHPIDKSPTTVRFFDTGECVKCVTHDPCAMSCTNGPHRFQLMRSDDNCPDCLDADGNVIIPQDRANQLGWKYYIPTSSCNRCGQRHPRRASDNRCMSNTCKDIPERIDPRVQARQAGHSTYEPIKPCKTCKTMSIRSTSTGRCIACHPINDKPLSPRQQALKDGDAWYWPDEKCKVCDQMSRKRVNNGACESCTTKTVKTLSPRQIAKDKGEMWYMPTTTNKCGHKARRRVNNGQCEECSTAK